MARTPRPGDAGWRPRHAVRAGAALVSAGAVLAGTSCSGPKAAPASVTLHRAAAATAGAKSFVVRVLHEEVIYQAPDRFEQTEQGVGSSGTADSSGTVSTSGLVLETITKLFIGDRYYEAAGPTGKPAPFSVSARCAGNTSFADYVLGVLRAMTTSNDIHQSGHGYAFTVPKGGSVPVTTSGTATIARGFVSTITVSVSGVPIEITIGSVGTAPPVTAPKAATDSTTACSVVSGPGASSGSATAPSPSSLP